MKHTTREQLERLLQSAGVDCTGWGKDDVSKPLDDLFEEIRRGETFLLVEEGQVVRKVETVNVTVTHKHLTLLEDRILWNDGHERRRSFRGSIVGKIQGAESPSAAAIRKIKEGLRLAVNPSNLVSLGNGPHEDIKSDSFPGLFSRFYEHYFSLELSESEFRSEGYSEKKEDKEIFFVWK